MLGSLHFDEKTLKDACYVHFFEVEDLKALSTDTSHNWRIIACTRCGTYLKETKFWWCHQKQTIPLCQTPYTYIQHCNLVLFVNLWLYLKTLNVDLPVWVDHNDKTGEYITVWFKILQMIHPRYLDGLKCSINIQHHFKCKRGRLSLLC